MIEELVTVTTSVNGARYTRVVEPRVLLSDFIRHELELTGTHVGCEHGVCGACTVLVDGLPMRSCLMLAPQAQGREISTIEGLAATDGSAHTPVRGLTSWNTSSPTPSASRYGGMGCSMVKR